MKKNVKWLFMSVMLIFPIFTIGNQINLAKAENIGGTHTFVFTTGTNPGGSISTKLQVSIDGGTYNDVPGAYWVTPDLDVEYPYTFSNMGVNTFRLRVFRASSSNPTGTTTYTALGSFTVTGPPIIQAGASATITFTTGTNVEGFVSTYLQLSVDGGTFNDIPGAYWSSQDVSESYLHTFEDLGENTFRLRVIMVSSFNPTGTTSYTSLPDSYMVIDTIAPTISNEPDFSMNLGTSQTIIWDVFDYTSDQFNITVDGVVVDSGTWSNGILSYTFNPSEIGTYTIICSVDDAANLVGSDTVYITIEYPLNPTITDLLDSTLEYGSNNTYSWTVNDNNPANYQITVEGVEVQSGISWSDGDILSYSFTPATTGTFSIVCSVWDKSGNSISDTSIITVEDTILPTISTQNTIVYYIVGTTGNTLTWAVSDLLPDNFILSIDDVNGSPTPWDGKDIIVDIDGLEIGMYEYVLNIIDTSGNGAELLIQDIVIADTETTGSTTTTTTTTDDILGIPGFNLDFLLIFSVLMGLVVLRKKTRKF